MEDVIVMGTDLFSRVEAADQTVPDFYHIHYADLDRILVDRITALEPSAIFLDRRVVRIVQDGDRVATTCQDGCITRSRILLAA